MGPTKSVALLREGGKYYQKCKLFDSYMTFQSCLSPAVKKLDPLLNLLGKLNLQLLAE